jgi:Protein of unknown function (DUF3617)
MNHKGQWRVYAIASTLLICGAIPLLAGQKAQTNPWKPLNVKTGLWERTISWTRTGEQPLPASILQSLSPEQRARIEQRMKANAGTKIKTVTEKNCVTSKDLDNPPDFTQNGKCTWSTLESSSTRERGTVSCEAEGIRMNGNGDFAAPDQEHMNGLIHLTTSGEGHTMTMNGNFKSRWIGPSCGNLKK